MAVKIYASDNYVVVDDGSNIYEYAKGHTIYTFKDGVYTIKELTQGEYKVTQAQLTNGDITGEDSGDVYTESTFVTFLRQNTGFKTASGGSGAISGTGSPTAVSNIWVGTQAEYDALTPVSTTLYFIK
jgi:hypothetical protein